MKLHHITFVFPMHSVKEQKHFSHVYQFGNVQVVASIETFAKNAQLSRLTYFLCGCFFLPLGNVSLSLMDVAKNPHITKHGINCQKIASLRMSLRQEDKRFPPVD